MYKSNSNFGAGCPNWADLADLRFGFVHSTDVIEQNKSVYHNQDTSTHIWWIGIENLSHLPEREINPQTFVYERDILAEAQVSLKNAWKPMEADGGQIFY